MAAQQGWFGGLAKVVTGEGFSGYYAQGGTTIKNAAATLTMAELLGLLITYTGAAANLTMPTASAMDAGLGNSNIGTNASFDVSIINTGSGTVTLVANTGITLAGSATVATGASGLWRMRKTGSAAWTAYRIA